MNENNECEECYSYYVAIVEAVFGDNTLQVGECYFWLAQFYFENHQY